MEYNIKQAFEGIHANPALKRQTMAHILSQKKGRPRSYRLAPVLAAVVMVCTMGGYAVYQTPVSYINIQVNPSIELSVNTFDRVVGVTAQNDDAVPIAEAVSLKNLTYVDAIETLSNAECFAPYADGDVTITVLSDKEDTSETMVSNIQSCAFGNQNNVHCTSSGQGYQHHGEQSGHGHSYGK